MRSDIYLTFAGNCRQAFEFYRSVFGGEFSYMGTYASMPDGALGKAEPADKDRILHVGLPLSGGSLLMGCDGLSSADASLREGNNFAVMLSCEAREEADRVFNALAQGGEIIQPMTDMFWGDYFGHCRDSFGIRWMITFTA